MKLMRTVVHVGMQKTGTTSLQKQYFPYIAKELGCSFNPKHIIDVCDSAVQKKFLSVEDEIKYIRKYALSKKFIISYEALVGDAFYSFVDHERAIDFVCRAFGSDVDIILVLRNQADMIESLYRHSIKKRESISFDNFINFDGLKFSPIASCGSGLSPLNVEVRIDYPRMIKNLNERFSTVHVFYYEMLSRDPDNFYGFLSGALGYRKGFRSDAYKRSNVSINYIDVKVVRLFGMIFMWNHINYPWRKGNYFGWLTRIFFNKLSPYIFKLINSLVVSDSVKCKKFVDEYRKEILSENAWNRLLNVPPGYEQFYYTQDKI